jgi:hypothetical protein
MLFMSGKAGTIRKAGRRGIAVRAALGVAVAVPLALAGPQTGFAGTQPGFAGTHGAGTGWVLQTLPAPAGRFGGNLNGVSCASADACMAVGDALTRTIAYSIAEAWNGTTWTLGKIPNPSSNVNLFGVSCPSATSCIAVGRTFSAQTPIPLAENWNGIRWTVGAPVEPPHVKSSAFGGVSCLAKQGCIAVGSYFTRKGKHIPLGEQRS